jgi:hypothetical protein
MDIFKGSSPGKAVDDTQKPRANLCGVSRIVLHKLLIIYIYK